LASELRWILAAICVPLLAAIWWWSARRSRQAPGNAELREPASTSGYAPHLSPPHSVDHGELPKHGNAAEQGASVPQGASAQHGKSAEYGEPAEDSSERVSPGDWGVPPFEPLSIRTADFDEVHVLESPMMAHADPLDESEDIAMAAEPAAHASPAASPPAAPPPAARPPAAPSDSAATGSRPQVPNSAETQRIVMVRVCAVGESRWSGVDLLAALDDHGLAHGRYQVFHRKHSDGRSLFCAASLVEPGTFNLAQMPAEHYRGLTLFAVLPGPADALQTIDALIDTAEGLAQTLHGMVQDAKGQPLSPERAEALREDVARFQASLTMG
jgi:cell division protein ZipA